MARMMMRRRRRPKKRYAWTGLQTLDTILPVGPAQLILSPVGGFAGGDAAHGVDLLVERVIFDFNWNNTTANNEFMAAYLAVFPSDLAGTVPVGMWAALTTDPDAFEKRVMWYRQFYLDPGPGGTGQSISTPAGGPFDINVKRKLRGDDILCLCIQQGNAIAQPVRVSVLMRCLVSMGRV